MSLRKSDDLEATMLTTSSRTKCVLLPVTKPESWKFTFMLSEQLDTNALAVCRGVALPTSKVCTPSCSLWADAPSPWGLHWGGPGRSHVLLAFEVLWDSSIFPSDFRSVSGTPQSRCPISPDLSQVGALLDCVSSQ